MNETLTNNAVATIKAERVNDFIFLQARPRRGDIPKYPDYQYGHPATVSVKVGNSVFNVTFKEHSKYTSHREYFWADICNNPFVELEKAGIAIDYLDILIEYQNALEKIYQKEKAIERAKNIDAIRALRAKYKTSWLTTAIDTLKTDPNKKIKMALTLSTLEVPDEDTYVLHANSHHLKVIYKGITATIHRGTGEYNYGFNGGKESNVSFYFNGSDSYKLPENFDSENDRDYNHRFKIEDGKVRRAKRLGTIYLKLIEAIDYELEVRRQRSIHKNKEAEKRAHILKKLTEAAGCTVHQFKEIKYQRGHRGISNGSYDVYTYKIVTTQPRYKYSTPEGIEISTSTETEWNGDVRIPKEETRTYSICGMHKLSPESFKTILNLYLKERGWTPIDKIVYPD